MNLIRPSADLCNRYDEISKLCRENLQPVYITVNGRGDTVLMSMENFQQMQAELELLRTLADAEEDVRAGRVAPIEDTFSDIRRRLLAGRDK